MPDIALTDRVKSLALKMGADLVGVAPSERYAEAPVMMSPEGHLPGAKCVVVIAIHHPDAAIELGGERDGQNDPQCMGPYAVQGAMNTKLECISFRLARMLEAEGHRVVAIPATNIWRFRPYKELEECFTPDLSNIHAGVAAGLGEIGWSGLLLTPEFGPRQRLCCLVTDADLVPSPLYHGPPLCDRCNMCVEWCPMDAFEQEVSGERVLHIGDKEVRYCHKNKWRCAWAEHFGLDLNLPQPDKITEDVILQQLMEHGRRGGEMGSCLRFCLPPHLRLKDEDYCRCFRRKRRFMDERPLRERNGDPRPALPDRPATENAYAKAFELGADLVGVALQEDFDVFGVKIRDYLPDGNSVVTFGVHFPASLQQPGTSESDARPEPTSAAVIRDRLSFISLDLCRYLESLGYSAVPGTDLSLGAAVPASGLATMNRHDRGVTPEFGTRQVWSCILTSAYLEKGRRAHPVDVRQRDPETLTTELRSLLRHQGADLVGVADPEQVNALIEPWAQAIDEDELQFSIRDTGGTHGPVKPVIEVDKNARLRRVEDHLAGAESVLVIGFRMPPLNLERAIEAPAEAAGPYSYATYQVNRELRYLAFDAALALERAGYQATITTDLSGSGTLVANPRGPQPDALANRFAAAAAGLGHIGWHGALITPQFGVTQRFIAVVTDAPLIPDKPLDTPSPCGACAKPCVRACPVTALSTQEVIEVPVNGQVHPVARWDRLRCEWAKKYGLIGDEGPKWGGQVTDVRPPEGRITPEQIAAALKQKDPIQKHWTCIVEQCLKACQVGGAWRSQSARAGG